VDVGAVAARPSGVARALAAVILAGGLAACRGDDFSISARLGDPPSPGDVPAVKELTLESEVPHRLELVLDDGETVRTATFDALAQARAVPVLGLTPGRTTRVDLVAEADDGGTATRSWRVRTPDLPDDFPIVEVLAYDPARAEPTWLLIDVQPPGGTEAYLALLDEAGQPVWWYRPPWLVGDNRVVPGGRLLFMAEGAVHEADWLGRIWRRWGALPALQVQAWIPVQVGLLHHEVFPLDEGFLSLDRADRAVSGYPTDYDLRATADATVAESEVVLVGWDGEVEAQIRLGDVLDPTRIGFDSLAVTDEGSLDWDHANGVVPDPRDDGIIVSARHQDCVFEVGRDGSLRWILGTHAGWDAPWSDRLLEPVGELTWPYHPHAPELAPDGTLLMFDNHQWGHNPYEPAPDEVLPSRVVRYRIDEDALTVEQVASFDQTSTGTLSSEALGAAHHLPLTGNTLGVFGMVVDEGGVTNTSRGWGRVSVRVVEWTPTGEVVRDLRLRTNADDVPAGVKSYRAWPVPTPWTGAGASAGRWSDGG
jgi:arylsulfate sulfotransferase